VLHLLHLAYATLTQTNFATEEKVGFIKVTRVAIITFVGTLLLHNIHTRYIPDAAALVGSIRAGEAYGQAERQSVKKPIEVLLVRSRPAQIFCLRAKQNGNK